MEVLNSFMTWIFKSRLGQIEKFKQQPLSVQQGMLAELLDTAKATEFGKKYHFSKLKSYQEFAARVPLVDYESFSPYIKKPCGGSNRCSGLAPYSGLLSLQELQGVEASISLCLKKAWRSAITKGEKTWCLSM